MARLRRREVVCGDEVGAYHCVQRVVRRAALCGEDRASGADFGHRRDWIKARLERLAGAFAVEVAAFAVMDNHMHLVAHIRPDLAAVWDDREVMSRWLAIFPGTPADAAKGPAGGSHLERSRAGDDAPSAGEPTGPAAPEEATLLTDPARLAEVRRRLSDLSWFMRALAEPIARMANREDGCTGRFWEGRFRCRRILDEAALLACLAYVDLNPVRAGVARAPEEGDRTSAGERIAALLEHPPAATEAVEGAPCGCDPAAAPMRVPAPDAPSPPARGDAERAGPRSTPAGPRDGWLSPIELRERDEPPATAPPAEAPGSCRPSRRASDRGLLPMTTGQYLELLDWTGRQLRADGRGAIAAALPPILERLRVRAESWPETLRELGRRFHRAVGSVESLRAEARRAGRRWLHGMAAGRAAFLAPPA